MSNDQPSRPQLELLSDLRVDRQERVSPPPRTQPGPGARPAFELRITPLAWTLPRLALLPGGAGLTLSGGPVRIVLTLR